MVPVRYTGYSIAAIDVTPADEGRKTSLRVRGVVPALVGELDRVTLVRTAGATAPSARRAALSDAAKLKSICRWYYLIICTCGGGTDFRAMAGADEPLSVGHLARSRRRHRFSRDVRSLSSGEFPCVAAVLWLESNVCSLQIIRCR